jgi:hypothetical protein
MGRQRRAQEGPYQGREKPQEAPAFDSEEQGISEAKRRIYYRSQVWFFINDIGGCGNGIGREMRYQSVKRFPCSRRF